MIMPANFSAIAENEMTYVDGGAYAYGTIGSNVRVSTLISNVATMIGNYFIPTVAAATLGQLFGGSYKFGNVTTGIGDGITAAYEKNASTSFGSKVNGALNAGLQIVGGLMAITQLTLVDVKPFASNVLDINGKKL